jgi:hypothetical protein
MRQTEEAIVARKLCFGHQSGVAEGTLQHILVGRGVSNEVRPVGLAVPAGMLLLTRSLLEDAQKTGSSTAEEVNRGGTLSGPLTAMPPSGEYWVQMVETGGETALGANCLTPSLLLCAKCC